MYTTHLRKVGGSVMLAVPPLILDQLQLKAGIAVDVHVQDGQLRVAPVARPRYALADLLAQCDPDAPLNQEERQWLDAPAVGAELL